MKKKTYLTGQIFGSWTLDERIGQGGNGEVWSCINVNGDKRAIKILKSINLKSYNRFKDEVLILESNKDLKGLIPIEERFLPEDLTEDPYFIMPIALTSANVLQLQSIEEKVSAIIEIAEALSNLHKKGISHRDIKPANILYYNNCFVLSDFGLVDYPDKKDVTGRNENIGPKWTIAPEMKRESSKADGLKADIYSLAKTLWIFLTDEGKSFDGQYTTDSIIELRRFHPDSYTRTIDNLLNKCTDNDPCVRPTINEFIETLLEWRSLVKNFHERTRREWFYIQTKLFPTSIPRRVIWNSREDILKVLKLICSTKYLNHVFMPDRGGLDLVDVKISHEPGCLELDFEMIEIIKPKRLLFESFGDDPEWNYFRLELDTLKPIEYTDLRQSEYARITDYYEDVSELGAGYYYPYSVLNQNEGYYFVSYGRRVRRRFKGNFVIFGKRSTYNLTSDTYDGRHDKLSTDEFRLLIEKVIQRINRDKAEITNENSCTSEFTLPSYVIIEQPVYRCKNCGNIVDSSGNKLHQVQYDYNIAVLNKFGSRVFKQVNAFCCLDDTGLPNEKTAF